MKKLVASIAVMAVVAFAGAAVASECPLLIKQLNDGIAKMSDQTKVAEAKKLVAEAQQLHDSGKHADSIKKAEEAAKVVGITLKHKK